MDNRIKFCSQCGGQVIAKVPEGDDHLRAVCPVCDMIHYQNPKVITGCLPVWEDKVLLCRRAIEPRHGFWTLPAGFMENGETTQQGAARETLEEAQARVDIVQLYSVFSLPVIDQVYMLYRGHLLDLDFAPGDESLEVALFSEDQIPWDEVAFHVVTETLRFYFSDRKTGLYRLHSGTIEHTPGPKREYKTLVHE